MSRQNLLRCILAVVPMFMIGSTAFGWAGISHSRITQATFDDPVLAPFLSQINQSAIESYTSEPPTAAHNAQFTTFQLRGYIDTASADCGYNWNSVDETTRLKYLMHLAGDVAVPAHHSPASQDYDNLYAETLVETEYAGRSYYGSVAGTSNYAHTRTGHSYSFTGTIDQIVSTFESACRDNAAWYHSTRQWWGHYSDDVITAGWNGVILAQMLQRAALVDYMLAKQQPHLDINLYHTGEAGGTITLDQYYSYDPDAISWNSDGTYTQIYGVHPKGFQYFMWDVNCDGIWDYTTNQVYATLSVNELIAMGVPTNQWTPFYTLVMDSEGKTRTVTNHMFLNSGGGVPEPATMSLLAVGGLALLRRRK